MSDKTDPNDFSVCCVSGGLTEISYGNGQKVMKVLKPAKAARYLIRFPKEVAERIAEQILLLRDMDRCGDGEVVRREDSEDGDELISGATKLSGVLSAEITSGQYKGGQNPNNTSTERPSSPKGSKPSRRKGGETGGG